MNTTILTRLFGFLCLLNLCNGAAFSQWTSKSTGFTSNYSTIEFLNNNIGYASINNIITPSLIKTTDAGNTWTQLPLDFIGNITKIQFTSNNIGWISTDNNAKTLMTSTALMPCTSIITPHQQVMP